MRQLKHTAINVLQIYRRTNTEAPLTAWIIQKSNRQQKRRTKQIQFSASPETHFAVMLTHLLYCWVSTRITSQRLSTSSDNQTVYNLPASNHRQAKMGGEESQAPSEKTDNSSFLPGKHRFDYQPVVFLCLSATEKVSTVQSVSPYT